MGAYLQPLIKKNLIIYKPEQWSTRLGQPCLSCNTALNHQKCISVCQCSYFCHQQCFSLQFQKLIFSQFTQVKCQKCNYILKLTLETQQKYKPEFSKWKVIKPIFWLLLMILTLVFIMITPKIGIKIQYAYFIMYLQGILLGVFLFFFIKSIKQILYSKSIKIREIVSTNLQIQTSAFRDFECETHQQTSKDYIAGSNNK